MTTELDIIFLVLHIFSFIIGILLIYYAVRLLQRLTSKDFAVSMIFLNERKIRNILLVLVIGSGIFFVGHIYTTYISYTIQTTTVAPSLTLDYVVVNIIGPIYSFSLLYFVYALQQILKGDNEWPTTNRSSRYCSLHCSSSFRWCFIWT